MKKLNLGCGFDIKPEYINVDIVNWPWVDKIFNFEKTPYPFEKNSFDEIYCSMVMEHVHNLSQMIDELVRICKNWAKIKIIVPYFSSPNVRWDITHVRGFNTNSFSWFHSNSLKSSWNITVLKQRIHFLSNNKFMKSVPINIIPDFLINICPKVYERFFAYRFPSSEIHYILEIHKD